MQDPAESPAIEQPIWSPEVRAKMIGHSTKTPRYLFRAHCRYSGGQIGLNTRTQITPLAFFEGAPRVPVWDSLSQIEFKDMAYTHLGGDQDIPSKFSSWSQSLNSVLKYAVDLSRHYSCEAFVSMIDTEILPENPCWYVPLLQDCFEQDECVYSNFHWKYLCYGVIEDSTAHACASLTKLEHSGLMSLFPGIPGFQHRNEFWEEAGDLPEETVPLTQEELIRLASLTAPIGEQGGRELGIAFLCYLICLHRRSPYCWSTGVFDEVTDMILQQCYQRLPAGWETSLSITSNNSLIAMLPIYEDVAQTVRLMRALSQRLSLLTEKKKRKQQEKGKTNVVGRVPDTPISPVSPKCRCAAS